MSFSPIHIWASMGLMSKVIASLLLVMATMRLEPAMAGASAMSPPRRAIQATLPVTASMAVTPPERSRRITDLLDSLGLARDPLPYPLPAVLDHLATDKKHAGGRLRWVLPTATGVEVRADVPAEVVEAAASGLLATPSAA